jgi:uncharacterized protein (DUF302 family)
MRWGFDHEPLVTFRIREPYRVALAQVRRTLTQEGLRLAAEVDVAGRIRRELGPGVAPCTLLLVDDPALLLEGVVFHRAAALGIPQPVVVSGNDLHTEVFVHGVSGRPFPGGVDRPLVELRRRVAAALDAIAEREEVFHAGRVPSPLLVAQGGYGVDGGGAARGKPDGE